MATAQSITDNTEAGDHCPHDPSRKVDLPNDTAQAVLQLLSLDQADLDRMHELVTKNQADALTPAEKAELENYIRVSYFVDLMHAKARLSFKKHT